MSEAPRYDNSTDELVKLGYFAEMAKDIAAARTIRDTLDQIMRHVGEIFAPANWSLLLRDRQSGDLRFTLITGSAVDSLKGRVVPKGKGIPGRIAEFETRSIIGVPLKRATEVLGVIERAYYLNPLRREPSE